MQIDILHYLPEKTMAKLDKQILEEISNVKKVSEWSKILLTPLKNASRYLNGSRAIPIEVLNNILRNLKKDKSFLQDRLMLKIGRTGKFLKIGPFVEITPEWIYISELIKGDGHIPPNFWNITFVNNNNTLINYVKNFFMTLGLDESRIGLFEREDADFLIIRNSLLAHLFNRLFLIPIGRKEEFRIPGFVFKNKKFLSSAVRGAFDAEGSVRIHGHSREISICSESRLWINDLQEALKKLRIVSKISISHRIKPLYRLNIYHIINLKRFDRLIKPLHSIRSAKLKKIIEDFPKRVAPKGLFHRKILLILKDEESKRTKISKKLNRKTNLVGNDLRWLKDRKFISAKGFYSNGGSYYLYRITKKGKRFVEKNLDSFIY